MITFDDPDLRVSYDLLQLQWDLIRMCALADAGETPDADDDDDEED